MDQDRVSTGQVAPGKVRQTPQTRHAKTSLGAEIQKRTSGDDERMHDQLANYQTFLQAKAQIEGDHGFSCDDLPEWLFPFQRHLVEWSLRKGRAAIFADCGLGKTPMQLVWADRVTRHTNKPVLILTPLAVGPQTVREAEKFGIEAMHCRDGKFGNAKIVVTNYERLHYFDPNDFAGCVCDESSILKSYAGATRKLITRFVSKMPYRLLCTATAAPNDYVELGTSSEALGELTHSEMLTRFFKYLDDKGQKSEGRKQREAEDLISVDQNYYQKLAYRVAQTIGQWRLKHHAVVPFWQWVASWSRACRMPSDLGFENGDFVLPRLIENDHIITPNRPPDGMLFNLPAIGLGEEREERKRTLDERCEYAANLVDHKESAVIWCHANAEGDLLESIIPDAQQIAGATSDERKLELYEAFLSGELRVLVIKPKIGAWGLNWQHCRHVVSFATHSYEQYYQSVRRCWRFGQTKEVQLDLIATIGEERVLMNMRAKAKRAETMFDSIIREMNQATRIKREDIYTNQIRRPEWVS
jgi:SNF2 family DNA or RNA helicase